MIFDINKLYEENLKEFEEIDNIINNEGVSLFGAGEIGYFASSYLLKNDYKLHCIIDNDVNKINDTINNIKIVNRFDPLINKSDAILISAHHAINDIKNSINTNKKCFTFDKWFVMKYFNDLLNIRNIFYDDISKNIFDILIYAKLLENVDYCSYAYSDNQYFSINQFKYKNGNEIYVDAGAYVGDTLEKFLYNNYGLFKKIYAFEPGLKQFNAMKLRLERISKEWAINNDNIILMNAGLSDSNTNAYLTSSNQLSGNKTTSDSTENIIVLYSIDNFLNGEPITFLKSDIEGEELNMLKGAENTIKKYKPKMAISVYHRPDDLLTIPKYIKELVPEYNFSLRHHSLSFNDTVLYCWVNKDQTRPDQTRPDQTRPDQY